MERRNLSIPTSVLSTALAISVDPVSDVLYIVDSGAIRLVGPDGYMRYGLQRHVS